MKIQKNTSRCACDFGLVRVAYVLVICSIVFSAAVEMNQPQYISVVPFSYSMLFLYALRTFCTCAMASVLWVIASGGNSALCQFCRKMQETVPLFCFVPPAVFGVLVLCGESFNVVVRYSQCVFYGSCATSFFLATLIFTPQKHIQNLPESADAEQGNETLFCGLSPRESDVARLLLKGSSTEEIAAVLFISVATVKTHIQSIFRKYDVHSRVEFAWKLSHGAESHPK